MKKKTGGFLSNLKAKLFRWNYDAGRNDRLGENWTPVIGQTAEEVDKPHRTILMARGRDLERNSDIVGSSLLGVIRNTVGDRGILPQARILKTNGTDNEKLNDQIEELWTEWVRPVNCDASGQSSFTEIQAITLRRRIVDGEIFVRKIITKDPKNPLKLQLLESDQLDLSKYGDNIYDGIEVDEFLKPIRYWFYKNQMKLGSRQESIGIPASEIIHLFTKKRPSQIHGISELAIVMQRIKDTKEYIDAELVAARIAACFAIFIRKINPGSVMGRMGTGDGNKPLQSIEPGMIQYLNVGEDVVDARPNHPQTTAGDFISLQQRLAGAGLGQSYELLSRDLSKVSYSSVRQGHLEDRKNFEGIQQFIVEHLCIPIWEAFVEASILAGSFKVPDFYSNKSRYTKARWITPGWQWVDPLKEVRAAEVAISMGVSTLEEVCGQRGSDWQEVLKQRAREIEFADSIGLEYLSTTPVDPYIDPHEDGKGDDPEPEPKEK